MNANAKFFHFNQRVMTPNGEATFIGYMMPDGHECQVSRWVMRDGKKICVNEVYAEGQISETKSGHQPKPEPPAVSSVADAGSAGV